jgi:hypothetical protein
MKEQYAEREERPNNHEQERTRQQEQSGSTRRRIVGRASWIYEARTEDAIQATQNWEPASDRRPHEGGENGPHIIFPLDGHNYLAFSGGAQAPSAATRGWTASTRDSRDFNGPSNVQDLRIAGIFASAAVYTDPSSLTNF